MRHPLSYDIEPRESVNTVSPPESRQFHRRPLSSIFTDSPYSVLICIWNVVGPCCAPPEVQVPALSVRTVGRMPPIATLILRPLLAAWNATPEPGPRLACALAEPPPPTEWRRITRNARRGWIPLSPSTQETHQEKGVTPTYLVNRLTYS